MFERGRLKRRTEECLYCDTCERYPFEAYIVGGCPVCRRTSDGNSCEHWARRNVCADLTADRRSLWNSPGPPPACGSRGRRTPCAGQWLAVETLPRGVRLSRWVRTEAGPTGFDPERPRHAGYAWWRPNV
ncbi:class I tRNA ligase family protein [Streptomyces sp. NBC_00272]|uniref:class I tRNA ligase family protein n=1 Tax=Streptomyces sp. NBC_00272 TaxID=2975698 RepID=UPI002E2C5560|nr:class I tRNA ligase family protein [Streptomyces sp. NBC_00272]